MDHKVFRKKYLSIRDSKLLLACGSAYELPLRYLLHNPTDADRLVYMSDICAVNSNRRPPKYFKGTVLIIESADNHPGFAKLKRIKRDNSYFLSPQKLRNSDNNGPALIIIDGDFYLPPELRYVLQQFSPAWKQITHMKIDECYSVYCPFWPEEANEWLRRERHYGWPDQRLVDRIKRGSCHFVSKPHQNNPHDKTQWRFSFSKAELILIHSWTPVQKHVYHLLRIIKDKITEACGGSEKTVLRTYYFKTLMFWACEQKPSEFWNEGNIEVCVRELLAEMMVILIDRNCPNYFIPDNNMIDFWEESIDVEKELNLLTDYVSPDISLHALDPTSRLNATLHQSKSRFSLSNRLCEFLYLSCRTTLFPVHEKWNMSLRSKLYLCQCVLPELKDLHSAIIANVHLVSIPKAFERVASKDYSVALRGYKAALNASTDERFKVFEFDFSRLLDCSLEEILQQMSLWPLLFHRENRERNLETECELSKFENELELPERAFPTEFFDCKQRERQSRFCNTLTEEPIKVLFDGFPDEYTIMKTCNQNIGTVVLNFVENFGNKFSNQIPSPLYVVSVAYLANFYYSTMKDYERSSRLCCEIFERRDKLEGVFECYTHSHFERTLPF